MNLLSLPGRVSDDGKRLVRPFGNDYCVYERVTLNTWQLRASGLTPGECARFLIKAELPAVTNA